jgi:hypothetical protein
MGDDLIALPVANPEDPEKVAAAFGDAKDKWAQKGDKWFYLHTETGNLYTWDPLPRGTLFLFQSMDGQAVPIWTQSQPEFNAAIWTLLPLPPQTGRPADAAQAAKTAQTPVLLLKFKGSQPVDSEELARERTQFQESMDIHPQVMARVAQLEPATQQYVIKKFRPTGHNNSKSLTNFLNTIEKNAGALNDDDGNRVDKIMRVDYTGGILGCTLPDLGSFDGITKRQGLSMSVLEKRPKDAISEANLRASTQSIQILGEAKKKHNMYKNIRISDMFERNPTA